MNSCLQFIIVNLASLFIGIGVVFNLLWSFLKNPKHKFWEYKTREKCPEILNDKKYGNHKFIQLKDVKLHYVESGPKEKELMVFVHGFPEFWFSWRHQIAEFSKDYWTVAFDMRGYGDSEKKKNPKEYELEYLTDDIKNLVTVLGRQKFTLVAHDWGGCVGHCFIRKYPEMLNKYILINTVYSKSMYKTVMENREQFFKSWYIFLFRIPYLPEFLIRCDDLKIMELMVKNSTKEEIEAYKYTFRNYDQLYGPITYYRVNFMSKSAALLPNEDALNSLKVPGMYIHGNDDVAITVEAGYTKSFQDVQNLKYVNIPGADHFVHLTNPKKVNDIIRDFLKSS